MTFEIFKGSGAVEPGARLADSIPNVDRRALRSPENYSADADLTQAVNTAIWLRMPLLVTGEPGTGKTQLAFRVAAELGLGEPLVFETKSSSVAQDLFYTFDAVRRFAMAQVDAGGGQEERLDPRRFIRYQALGMAILMANEPAVARRWLPPDHALTAFEPHRSVVLIDEVDKAPRDFPNDLLSEIDRLAFKVPEIGEGLISAPESRSPIVIITSNSEKQLPDAFLRRCVYHHIDFPDGKRLAEIVARRMPMLQPDNAFLNDAIQLFISIRESAAAKKPSTAELLNLLDALSGQGVDFDAPLRGQIELVRKAMSTLIKTQEDIPAMAQHLKALAEA